jgi:hypothetical protein
LRGASEKQADSDPVFRKHLEGRRLIIGRQKLLDILAPRAKGLQVIGIVAAFRFAATRPMARSGL